MREKHSSPQRHGGHREKPFSFAMPGDAGKPKTARLRQQEFLLEYPAGVRGICLSNMIFAA
jgi:hypothetical protein